MCRGSSRSWLSAGPSQLTDHVRHGFGPDDLSPARVEEFVTARRAAGYVNYVTPGALETLLEHMRDLGVVPPADEPMSSEVECCSAPTSPGWA
jgi:hypothetical protein